MKVGTAQLDITPRLGLDLAGFAVRPQPAISILDSLSVRILYLEDNRERFLWVHADLLALDQPLADRFRLWVYRNCGIPTSRVVVATTHTHSGPATIRLTACGEVNLEYLSWLKSQFHQAVRLALRSLEPCHLLSVQGRCELGKDRRGFASAHTDPRVGGLGWRRLDGSYKAVMLNYSMHPVCLRGYQISADWPGEAARVLSKSLPGNPVAFVCPGACGNINPPGVGVEPNQMRKWGREVAEQVLAGLLTSPVSGGPTEDGVLRVASTTVQLPLEDWDAGQIEGYAQSCLDDPAGHREFGDKFRLAVETWRGSMIERVRRGQPAYAAAELGVVSLGPAALVTVNAEIFSRFTDLASQDARCPVYTVSCANGMIGYVSAAEAYDEGAYEVLWSMFFYNLPRPRKGCLELLAENARRLLCELRSGEPTTLSSPSAPGPANAEGA